MQGAFDHIKHIKKLVRHLQQDKRVVRLQPAAFRRLAGVYADQAVSKSSAPASGEPLFDNPFTLADFAVFEDTALKELFRKDSFGVSLKELALAWHGDNSGLSHKISRGLPVARRFRFLRELNRPAALPKIEAARRKLLDAFFWELTYWKTPDLYEELTAGEKLHPGIFRALTPLIRGKTVLDAGAGSGRASFESLQAGAGLVYAVEPSPGLLKILAAKLKEQPAGQRIVPLKGRFDALPLRDNMVDVALSSSAFTADPEQGGEPGLKELVRVTRNGGIIVIIWPRPQDYGWLAEHDFSYVSLPGSSQMRVSFSSLSAAWRAARRFYARNRQLRRFLKAREQPEVPFSVLGINPPHDYCWLAVHKPPRP